MDQTDGSDIIWQGRPWVMPFIILRAAILIILAIFSIWLEFMANVATQLLLGIPLFLWTPLIFALIWLITIAGLLLKRSSNHYILKKQGLEVRSGLISTKTYMLSAIGFSDLEVTRSAFQRILRTGNIYLRAESRQEIKLENIYDPVNVSNLLKSTLSRPYFRVEKDEEKR